MNVVQAILKRELRSYFATPIAVLVVTVSI